MLFQIIESGYSSLVLIFQEITFIIPQLSIYLVMRWSHILFIKLRLFPCRSLLWNNFISNAYSILYLFLYILNIHMNFLSGESHNCFLDVEPFLHRWYNSHLIKACILFTISFNLVWYNFLENFSVYIYQEYRPVNLSHFFFLQFLALVLVSK